MKNASDFAAGIGESRRDFYIVEIWYIKDYSTIYGVFFLEVTIDVVYSCISREEMRCSDGKENSCFQISPPQ